MDSIQLNQYIYIYIYIYTVGKIAKKETLCTGPFSLLPKCFKDSLLFFLDWISSPLHLAVPSLLLASQFSLLGWIKNKKSSVLVLTYKFIHVEVFSIT